MTKTRNDGEKILTPLTISKEEKDPQVEENEPLSGYFIHDSDNEDNEIVESTKEYKIEELDILALAIKQDRLATKKLLQVWRDYQKNKVNLESLREKLSLQNTSAEYKGTNAVWWLARNAKNSDTYAYLIKNLITEKVLTAEHLAAQCQGSKFTGTSALFWITRKHYTHIKPYLVMMANTKLITEAQLQAQYNPTSVVDTKIKQYRGYNVFDLMVENIFKNSTITYAIIILLRYELESSNVITNRVISDRVAGLIHKNLSHQFIKEDNNNVNGIKPTILALHMILYSHGRSLIENNEDSPAASIIKKFNDDVINLLIGVCPSPLLERFETNISNAEWESLADVLINQILPQQTYHFFEPNLMLLPKYTLNICDLQFFNFYLKKHLLPLARKQALDQSIDSFIKRSEKLVNEVILDLPGDNVAVIKKTMSTFAEVIKLSLSNYFEANPTNLIDRAMQKNITAHIMAEFTKEVIPHGKEFTIDSVQKILIKCSNPAVLENEYKKSDVVRPK